VKAKSHTRQVERIQAILKFATEDQLKRLRIGKSTINKEYEKIIKDRKRQEFLSNIGISESSNNNNQNIG
jgi:hypothetical protein